MVLLTITVVFKANISSTDAVQSHTAHTVTQLAWSSLFEACSFLAHLYLGSNVLIVSQNQNPRLLLIIHVCL